MLHHRWFTNRKGAYSHYNADEKEAFINQMTEDLLGDGIDSIGRLQRNKDPQARHRPTTVAERSLTTNRVTVLASQLFESHSLLFRKAEMNLNKLENETHPVQRVARALVEPRDLRPELSTVEGSLRDLADALTETRAFTDSFADTARLSSNETQTIIRSAQKSLRAEINNAETPLVIWGSLINPVDKLSDVAKSEVDTQVRRFIAGHEPELMAYLEHTTALPGDVGHDIINIAINGIRGQGFDAVGDNNWINESVVKHDLLIGAKSVDLYYAATLSTPAMATDIDKHRELSLKPNKPELNDYREMATPSWKLGAPDPGTFATDPDADLFDGI